MEPQYTQVPLPENGMTYCLVWGNTGLAPVPLPESCPYPIPEAVVNSVFNYVDYNPNVGNSQTEEYKLAIKKKFGYWEVTTKQVPIYEVVGYSTQTTYT